jgi:hypothetical protein
MEVVVLSQSWRLLGLFRHAVNQLFVYDFH